MTEHPASGMAEAAHADPGMRLLRAVVFSAVCVSASGCAHVLAAGAGLPLGSLLAGWLTMLFLVTPLAGRERSRPGIIAMLLCGQMVLHVVFSVGQCRAAAAGTGEGGFPSAAHEMPGHEAGAVMGASLMPGPAMFALHLAAAALLGWLVHHGDRALWGLVRVSRRAAGTLTGSLAVSLSALLSHLPALPLHVLSAAGPRSEAERGSGGIVLLHYAVIRRGPPTIV